MSTHRRVIAKLIKGLIALGFVLLAFLGVGLLANGVISVSAAGSSINPLAAGSPSPGATNTTTVVPPGQSPTATKTRRPSPTPTNTPISGSPTVTTTVTATVTATVVVTPTIPVTRTPKPTPTPQPTQGAVIPVLNTPTGGGATPTTGPSPSPNTGTPTAGITPAANTTTDTQTPTGNKNNDDMMGMIMPIGGGVVGFMALAAVGFVIWQRRKRQDEEPPALPAWQMGGAAMVQAPPVMQTGWADQRQWEMQFGSQNHIPPGPPEVPPARIPPPQEDYATTFYEEPQLDSKAMRAKFAQFSSSPDDSFYQRHGNDDPTFRSPGPDMNTVMAASGNQTMAMPPDGTASQLNGTMLGSMDGLDQYNAVPARASQYPNGNGNGNGHQAPTPPPQPQLPPSPLNDPFLEAIMRQAQMGIFAAPGKEG